MSICTGLKQQAGDGMGEKKERGRFTLRFNEGDPIHETAIGLLELQSPRTKAQYVANAVVYYNDQTERGYEPRAKPRRALFYKVFRGFHHVIIHINMVLFFIIYNFVNDTFKG